MSTTALGADQFLVPAVSGLSTNLIAVLAICGAVILGVVWMALNGSGGGSD